MDPATLVTSALLAGAGAGLTDAASAAVRDACQALRQACLDRLPGRRPDATAQELAHRLAGAAALDAPLLALAERVMTLADPEGTRRGAYRVTVQADLRGAYQATAQADLRGARGVQQGDHNIQHNTFH